MMVDSNWKRQLIGLDEIAFAEASEADRVEWAKNNTTCGSGLCPEALAWLRARFTDVCILLSTAVPHPVKQFSSVVADTFVYRLHEDYRLPALTKWWFDADRGCITRNMVKPTPESSEACEGFALYAERRPDEPCQLRKVVIGDDYLKSSGAGWTTLSSELALRTDWPPYRWCRIVPAEKTAWWFNIESKLVKHTTHRDLGYGENWVEVSEAYAKDLADKPEGEWELRKAKLGDIVFDEYYGARKTLSDFEDRGPQDRGYCWCRPQPAETGWVEYAVKAVQCRRLLQYCITRGDAVVCSLDKAMRTLDYGRFGGLRFAGQREDVWHMITQLYTDKNGKLSQWALTDPYDSVPAVPVRARFWKGHDASS